MTPAIAKIAAAAMSAGRPHGASTLHHPVSTCDSDATRAMMRCSSPGQYASPPGGAYASRMSADRDSPSESASRLTPLVGNFSSSAMLTSQILQQCAQLLPRVMEVGSCRAARNSEHLPDLHVSKTFDVVQNDHRPCPFRKLRQRITQPRLQLSILRRITELSLIHI